MQDIVNKAREYADDILSNYGYTKSGELLSKCADEIERLRAELGAMKEKYAVAAWAAGMEAHNRARGLPCDAREVGSKAAQAIRELGGSFNPIPPAPSGARSPRPSAAGSTVGGAWRRTSARTTSACWPHPQNEFCQWRTPKTEGAI